MPGYNYQAGMSNNAVNAYYEGKVPKSELTAAMMPRKCSLAFAKFLIEEKEWEPCEWHHSSKFYNRTDFFSPVDLNDLLENMEPEELNALRQQFADKKKEDADVEIHENCTVKWLEWFGTRKNPKASEESAEGCRVAVKGQTATITKPNGGSFKKRLSTRGFSFQSVKN